MGPPWKRVPLRAPRGVQPLRIYLTLMIEIKSSMSADKIKGPIVIFTKAKKNSHAPQGLELLDLSWELPTGFTIPEHANKAATQKKMNNDE